MVNYLYDLDDIEKNHEAYAQQRIVVASKAVTNLARVPARDLVPLSDVNVASVIAEGLPGRSSARSALAVHRHDARRA